MQALTLPEIDAMDDTMRAEPMQAARVKPLPAGATVTRAVSCSQCGNQFMGLYGYSSCIQHRLNIVPARKAPHVTPGLHYEHMHSGILGADIRVGLEIDADPEDGPIPWNFGAPLAGVTLQEVWLGDCELSQHLTDTTVELIQAEACKHMARITK